MITYCHNLSGKIVVLYVLQMNLKKRFVYGAIAFIWIVIPAIEIMFTALTADIIQGTCIAFGVLLRSNYSCPSYQGFLLSRL